MGFDVNRENNKKQTPMFFAAAYSTADVISEMIKYKAITFDRDSHNRMPVHHAILKSKTANLKVLID